MAERTQKWMESGLATEIVDWESPTDPARPVNWSPIRKWLIVVTTTIITFTVSFDSSVYCATIDDVAAEFDVTKQTATLGIVVYVLAFALGPLVWGPASELYGRTTPLWIGYFMFCVWQIPLGLSTNIGTLLATRFLAGLFGSSTLAIIAGMYADFLGPVERGVSTGIFSIGVFSGPALGPIIGTVVTQHIGWRWTTWLTLIMSATCGIICYICTPETAESVLLRRRARALRYQTSNWALHAKCEETSADIKVFMEKYLTKPVRMIVLEPILLVFTIYMSLVYGILYLTFELYPRAFQTDRHLSPITASLSFLFLLAGIMIACVMIALHSIYYVRRNQGRGRSLRPEDRLPPVILGSLLLPTGLFWFSWTSEKDVPWTVQAASGILTGCGIILVFMSSNLFLIEVYLSEVNSALAINIFIRSIAAAAFPVISHKALSSLGVKWLGSLLGFMCLAIAPFPVLMMLYGSRIRSWSKYAK